MFVTFKARIIAIILGFALIIATVAGVAALIAGASTVPSNGKTVVLDAGHGGIDGGVSGLNSGIKESDINLAITKSLKYFLVKAGYKVVLTRKNSDGLYSVGDKNKKRSDMNKRREIIENARPDMVVSIHQNFFPLKSVRGAQVFYAPESTGGREIAGVMQSQLNLSLNFSRQPMRGDYYILQCTSYPSVLIECGFLSNPEDETLLVSAQYQEKMAYIIFCGIDSLLGPYAADFPGDIFS